MAAKKIIILGGGISGLSAAYFLSQKQYDVTLLEKNPFLGGWIQTEKKGDFFFDSGPHTLRLSKEHPFFELWKQPLPSLEKKLQKYIAFQGRLHAFPSNPFSFLFSPLTASLWLHLIVKRKKTIAEDDQSLYELMRPVIGKKACERLLDPLFFGIYAGDIKNLSSEICLPTLSKLLKEKASLSQIMRSFQNRKSSIYTFPEGMKTLIEGIKKNTQAEILCSHAAEVIQIKAKEVEVRVNNKRFYADHLVCALPAPDAAKVLLNIDEELSRGLSSLQMTSVVSVSLGYDKENLLPQGMGYLVPSSEQCPLRGVLFDSEFKKMQKTVLTGMLEASYLEKSDSECIALLLGELKTYLNISDLPDKVHVFRAKQALPQFLVGHKKKIENIRKRVDCFPQLHLLGNYFYQASVPECIRLAKELSLVL